MRQSYIRIAMLAICVGVSSSSNGVDESLKQKYRLAVKKSIPLIEKSSAEYLKKQQCYSCHHQSHAVIALDYARQKGFTINQINFDDQSERITKHLVQNKKRYVNGNGTGGQVDTAGYALWALEIAGTKDSVTDPVVVYLNKKDAAKKHWPHPNHRPPTSASSFTTTYLALRALKRFEKLNEADTKNTRVEEAFQWMKNAELKSMEDRVFQIRILTLDDRFKDLLKKRVDELLKLQNDDGGWSQNNELPSDAYATGTVLSTLRRLNLVDVDNQQVRKGMAFLLKTQKPDGSWHVKTRSTPIQKYFESGFPHEKDQFISFSATCWAIVALSSNFESTNQGLSEKPAELSD